MSEVFLSYDREDRAIAQQLADALHAQGWSVWWDREIPFGKAFDLVIEEQLNAARCVVVLWSKRSILSRWVKTEAGVAAERGCLVPVLIEDTPVPLEFKRIQTAMMQGWRGDARDPEFLRLVDSIKGMLGTSASAQPERAPAAMAPRISGRTKAIAAGAVVVALASLAIFAGKRDAGSPGDGAAPSAPTSNTSPAKARTPDTAAPTVTKGPAAASAGPGEFAIKVGDTVSEGVPRAGAGNIESPGAEDVYKFAAAAGQRVYFHLFEHDKSLDYIRWKLTDPEGAEVFNTCFGCGTPGAQTLRKAGTYTLKVSGDRDPGTGVYRFKLYDIPPPHEFPIKVGDIVKENVPGPGAGNIESPGVENIYKFSATAGQRMYFHLFEYDKSMGYLRWRLTDPDGTEIFNSCLGCGTPGVQTLRKAGSYALTFGSRSDPSTGIYRFKLFNVPPANEFSIKVGDTVKENVPKPGAGNIESPGAEDIYKFTAAPGQRVNFQMFDYEKSMSYIRWKLSDPDGVEIFNTCLGCGSPGTQSLRKGGEYQLKVGNATDPGTGVYRMQLTQVGGAGSE